MLGHDGTGEISRFASDPRGLRHEDIGDSSRFESDQVDFHEDIPHASMRPSTKLETKWQDMNTFDSKKNVEVCV